MIKKVGDDPSHDIFEQYLVHDMTEQQMVELARSVTEETMCEKQNPSWFRRSVLRLLAFGATIVVFLGVWVYNITDRLWVLRVLQVAAGIAMVGCVWGAAISGKYILYPLLFLVLGLSAYCVQEFTSANLDAWVKRKEQERMDVFKR